MNRYSLFLALTLGATGLLPSPAMAEALTNRLSDSFRQVLGLSSDKDVVLVPRPERPHTSFQTGGAFAPEFGVPTDAVLVYSDRRDAIQSWGQHGQTLQTMFGFRDGPGYVKEHPDAVQTDIKGNPLMCGGSYYLDPTLERLEMANRFAAAAMEAGSTAICPEEPEYFSRAGYSGAFKTAWQNHYGFPWEPPHASVDARYRSEQLKGFLEKRQIQTILQETKSRNPSVTRMVAVHSPVTYYQWGIPCPHYSLLNLPELQQIIGQVWTGTARSPVRLAGTRCEKTFEVGYLEYSSLYQLARGTGKEMWFLMDPVEDNPDRSMEDYHINYEQTLLASLMFPEINSFEVMPWPQRIYQRVPAKYAAEVNTVVGALCEMWRYTNGAVRAGTPGIGTFVADSMGWQREAPAASDYDGFYSLCLPLVMRGVPVQVLCLDRALERNYLKDTRVLLLSCDFLKPADAAINRALADWTREGGALVLFGGQDAYNGVTNSWWRKAGYSSPLSHLLEQLRPGTKKRSADGKPPGGSAEDFSGKAYAAASNTTLWETSKEAAASGLQKLSVPHTRPVTLVPPPAHAQALYQIPGQSVPPVWQAKVGKGTVLFVGVAPGFFGASAQTDLAFRALIARACQSGGLDYKENGFFLVQRGPYVAARTLNKPCALKGRYVDLLNPSLPLRQDITIPPGDLAFLVNAGKTQRSPRLLAVSGRLRASVEQARLTGFLAQAPAKTEGAARLSAGKRRLKEARAFDLSGAPLQISVQEEGDTVLAHYPNAPEGVIVRVDWQ